MATIRAIIRAMKVKTGKIQFRLTDGRDLKIYYKSDLTVDPSCWDAKKEAIKTQKFNDYTQKERAQLIKSIADLKDIIFKVYDSEPNKDIKNSIWLQDKVNRCLHPEQYEIKETHKQTFFEAWSEFLLKRRLSLVRVMNYDVVIRAMKRYELYKAKSTGKPFALDFDTITPDILRDLEKFLRTENQVVENYPEIYKEVKKSKLKIEPRGTNTISGMFIKIRTLFLWAIDEGKTINNPFKKFEIETPTYGTPYYITIEERNQLYNKDLSHKTTLAIQRDIFVFQCVIGCRVADLVKLTKSNLTEGAIEYIPRKTKDGRPITVRVPLNQIAKEILGRYADNEGNALLPFISPQKYNDAIKEAFTLAELTREVTIIDPTTREEDHQPLNKLASSHLARRCFIGNLYKQVQDPNLIGKLSGHAEGSKAFARYRDVDEQMKIKLVNLLD
jgi:integrase